MRRSTRIREERRAREAELAAIEEDTTEQQPVPPEALQDRNAAWECWIGRRFSTTE